MDTNNRFFVGKNGDRVIIMKAAVGALSRDDALNLAAWIVALTDEDEFRKHLKAIQNT